MKPDINSADRIKKNKNYGKDERAQIIDCLFFNLLNYNILYVKMN